MVDNPLVITEDLVIIYLSVWAWLLPYIILYCVYLVRQTWAKGVDPDETPQNTTSHQGLHCLPLVQLFLDITLGSKIGLFKFKIKYGKEIRCLNTKGKYGKVTDTEIKWSIISKSVPIIIFVEFINQLIYYQINCARVYDKKIL